MTTQDLNSVKKELADISTFLRERLDPSEEERARLRNALMDIAGSGSAAGLRATPMTEPGRPRVESGPYAGCDALDMAIARTLQQSATHLDTPDRMAWDSNIKAAMDSFTPGRGEEFTAHDQASQLWRDVQLETMVAPLFSLVSMPTDPFDVPVHSGDIDWFPGGENLAAPSSALATTRQTLTAHELVASVPWSLSLDEDSVVAMLPEVRRTLVRTAAEVIDDVLLNGDTTETNGINSDGATISKTTPGKAHWLVGFDGLIHLPLVDNPSKSTNLAGSVSATAYNFLLQELGKYGVRNNEAVFITDVNTYLSSLAIQEVETVDKLGPNATLLRGQLGVVYGHPLIVSDQMRLADTDGKVTDGGNSDDTGRILAVNTSQWRIGYRRQLTIDVERDAQKRQNIMVASLRIAFGERTTDRSTATHTALQYNITGVA